MPPPTQSSPSAHTVMAGALWDQNIPRNTESNKISKRAVPPLDSGKFGEGRTEQGMKHPLLSPI